MTVLAAFLAGLAVGLVAGVLMIVAVVALITWAQMRAERFGLQDGAPHT